jgi:hypothetical protein
MWHGSLVLFQALILRFNNSISSGSSPLLQNDVVDIGAHGLRRLLGVEWL